jgi:hypothetical protein
MPAGRSSLGRLPRLPVVLPSAMEDIAFRLAKAARSSWRDNDAAGRAVGDGFVGRARFVERVLSGDDGR